MIVISNRPARGWTGLHRISRFRVKWEQHTRIQGLSPDIQGQYLASQGQNLALIVELEPSLLDGHDFCATAKKALQVCSSNLSECFLERGPVDEIHHAIRPN